MFKGRKNISVAGITFSSDDIISVVIKKDGRQISIGEKETNPPEKKSTPPGFAAGVATFTDAPKEQEEE